MFGVGSGYIILSNPHYAQISCFDKLQDVESYTGIQRNASGMEERLAKSGPLPSVISFRIIF